MWMGKQNAQQGSDHHDRHGANDRPCPVAERLPAFFNSSTSRLRTAISAA
jgi:hypothetical protein